MPIPGSGLGSRRGPWHHGNWCPPIVSRASAESTNPRPQLVRRCGPVPRGWHPDVISLSICYPRNLHVCGSSPLLSRLCLLPTPDAHTVWLRPMDSILQTNIKITLGCRLLVDGWCIHPGPVCWSSHSVGTAYPYTLRSIYLFTNHLSGSFTLFRHHRHLRVRNLVRGLAQNTRSWVAG